jgi:hypothetical protein
MRTNSSILIAATGLGIAGVAAAYIAGGDEGHARFWASWLFWFLLVLTTGLGALFILGLEHLVGSRWSVPVRRVPERLSTLALFAAPLGFIALLALPSIFPWARPEGRSPIVAGKSAWLNPTFFAVRVIASAALWALCAWVLVGGSIRQDRTRDPRFNLRARRFAPACLAIFAITITLVAFDWISSLEPEWYSDIFGVYVFAGSFLAGLAATVLGILHLIGRGRLAGIRSDHLYNLGGYLFAFTVFWSYIGFAQYMLIWYANMPEEVTWYAKRLEGTWLTAALVLAAVHFVIPFFALLPRDAKGDPRRLRRVALLVLFAHALDLAWMVYPSFGKSLAPAPWWQEPAFGLAFLGGALLWARWSMSWGEDMPVGDPFLREGLEFKL